MVPGFNLHFYWSEPWILCSKQFRKLSLWSLKSKQHFERYFIGDFSNPHVWMTDWYLRKSLSSKNKLYIKSFTSFSYLCFVWGGSRDNSPRRIRKSRVFHQALIVLPAPNQDGKSKISHSQSRISRPPYPRLGSLRCHRPEFQSRRHLASQAKLQPSN